jgi:hypothetical protein
MKDPPAADDISNMIALNKKPFFSVCLGAIIICKQEVPAIELPGQ